MKYREFENSDTLLREQFAADRMSRHWRGVTIAAEKYLPYDRVLIDADGSTAALVEIKIRHYEMRYFIEHHYLLSLSKVKSLRHAAKRRDAVPIVMVACEDDDFLLDLRDESGTSLRKLPMNDRWYDERTGVTQMREEWLVAFFGSRFLPLDEINRLL